MNNPRFSIIAPIYKVAKYLPLFFECIDKQTFEDYELILVDDGSPDDSGKLCDDYPAKNQHARVIHKPNGGVSSARNTGLDNAMGEWILFYDPDDTIPSNALARISDALSENEKTDVAIYNYTSVKNNGHESQMDCKLPYNVLLDKSGVQHYLLCSMFNGVNVLRAPWTKAYKRSLIDSLDLRFSDRTFAEDYQFNLKYFQNINSAIAIKDSLYNYWLHPGTAIGRYHDSILNVWKEDTNTEMIIYSNNRDSIRPEGFSIYCINSFSSLTHYLQATIKHRADAKELILDIALSKEFRFVSSNLVGGNLILDIIKNAMDSEKYSRIKIALMIFRMYNYLINKLSTMKQKFV